MISSIKREELQDELKIPDKFDILMILALGKTKEKVIIDEVTNDDVKYWRDEEKNHHVPKRNLNDLIIKI
jgi:hypothetical protein